MPEIHTGERVMNGMTEAVTAPRTLSRAEHDAGMAAYREAGLRLAEKIGNRGPLRLTDDGALHPDIQTAYWRHGYYVFTGVNDPVLFTPHVWRRVRRGGGPYCGPRDSDSKLPLRRSQTCQSQIQTASS